jgi:transposase-like protein
MENKLPRNVLPKNLMGAIRYLSDPDACLDFIAEMRWPNGVTCPHCGGDRVSYLKTRRIWRCMKGECHKQFSAKTGSIFEESPSRLVLQGEVRKHVKAGAAI